MPEIKVKEIKGQFELECSRIDTPAWNPDLHPVPVANRTWTKWTMSGIWIAMCVNITTYMLGSSLISSGMNWWQAVSTVLLGNIIVLIPMAMIGYPGTKYGIPFPVLIRSCFGIQGAKLAAMLRAFVACGWFGIQSCIAGNALFLILSYVFPDISNSTYLHDIIGIDLWRLICIIIVVLLHALVIHDGIRMIKKLEVVASPILLLMGFSLFAWAWWETGSFTKVLEASKKLAVVENVRFFDVFWPGLTAIIGFWSTLALNIPDFTRYVRSQEDQIKGQAYTMPAAMALVSFSGIFVTSATILVFGKAIWDPVELLKQFGHKPILIIPLLGIILATLCGNMAANVVSPANDFSNLAPKYISFKTGGYITCVVGIIIFPWKLIADPDGYIFRWLIAYSALLGTVGGIMIADYYIIRDRIIDMVSLYSDSGSYIYKKGWNIPAFLCMIVAIIPNLPGFMMRTGIVKAETFPVWMEKIYDYAWFTSFILAFIVYTLAMLGYRKIIISRNETIKNNTIR